MIQSECWSDDRVVQVEFDATDWFKQASDEDVEELAAIGWGVGYAADVVAEFFENKNEKVKEMFQYIGILGRAGRTMGFECKVSENSAMYWLKNNRLELYKKLVAEYGHGIPND